MEKPFFDKRMSSCIKGILLILMYILHFFCFPDWYVDGVEYAQLRFMEQMQGHFQICIAGFAFLTGYFYAFTKKQSFRYFWKKIIEILIPYWVVYLVFFVIAFATKTTNFSAKSILLEICTVEHSVLSFCWYVSFYILSMLTLPMLKSVCRDSRTAFLLLGIIGPIALYYLTKHFISVHWIVALLEKYQVYFPIIIVGYATADFSLFEKLESYFQRFPFSRIMKIVFSLAFVIVVFTEPGWLYRLPMDGVLLSMIRKMIRICSIPFFVYGLISLLHPIKSSKALFPLELIGKYSLLMWFTHSIFFGCSKEIFQVVLFWPKNPVLVLLWGLIINLAISCIISIPIDRIKTATLKRNEAAR